MSSLASVMPASPAISSTAKPGNAPADADSTAFDALLHGEPATDASPGRSAEAPPSSPSEPVVADVEDTPALAAQHDQEVDIVEESLMWPPLGLSGLLMPAPQAPTPTALAAVPGVIGATADGATTPLSANLPGNAPAMISTPLSSTTAPVGDKQVGANMAPELVLAPSIVTESKTDAGEPSAITSLIQGMTAAGTSRATPELSAVLASPTPTPELGSDGFDDAVGARVGWLADQKIGHAHIRITPHDMGTIEVRLQIDGDRVHASFSSAHAEVRQALETSLGRLREMLGEQGLELAQADVGQQPGAQDQSGKHAQASDDGTHAGGTDNPALATHMNPLLLQRMGLLDAYA